MNNLTRFLEKLAPYGDFEKIKELNVIIDNILKTLSIPKGSYIADPEVGSNLFDYVFDPFDEDTLENIRTEIETSLDQIENITLENVGFEITPDRKNLVSKMTINVGGNIDKTVAITIVITQEYINLLSVEEIL